MLEIFAFRIEDKPRLAVIFKDITDRKRREANLAFLAEVADDFSRLSSADEIMETVGAKIKSHFGYPSRLSASYHDEERDEITVIYDNHEPKLPDAPRFVPISQLNCEKILREMREGRVIAVNDMATDPRTLDKFAEFTTGGRSLADVRSVHPRRARGFRCRAASRRAARLALRRNRAFEGNRWTALPAKVERPRRSCLA